MRLFSWSLVLAALATFVLAEAGSDDEGVIEEVAQTTDPEVAVTASFPEDNPFGRAFILFFASH